MRGRFAFAYDDHMERNETAESEARPLCSAVAELRREGRRMRVTFRSLSAAYYLDDDHPQQATLLKALERSARTGGPIAVTYVLETNAITGFAD